VLSIVSPLTRNLTLEIYSPGNVLSKQQKHREKSPEFFYNSTEFLLRMGFNKKKNSVWQCIAYSVKKNKLHHNKTVSNETYLYSRTIRVISRPLHTLYKIHPYGRTELTQCRRNCCVHPGRLWIMQRPIRLNSLYVIYIPEAERSWL